MANVGTVQSIIGTVRAIAEDGTERILSVGDAVAENEKIITTDGVIVIAFTDGTVMDLGSNSSIVLNDDVLNPEGEQIAQSKADAENEVAALQDALINNPNFDPTQALPATAAGAPAVGGTGNNGHTSVSVDYLNPEGLVTSGHDTVGINVEFSQTDPELPPVIEDNDEPNALSADDSPVITLGQSSDIASEFTVENHDEVSSAGFHNSYGYYVKTLDPNGDVISDNPTTGVVIEDDVHFKDGGFTLPVTVIGYSQEQIGYFIIPNGDGKNSMLADGDQVYFSFVGGQWQAFFDAGYTSPIVGAGSHVLFDVGALNKDGQDHMVDNGLIGNQNWEDLHIPNGDVDYNDVNINVDWTKVTVTGDVVDSVTFGADGPGVIDFTFDAGDIVSSGVLTSNGNSITFVANDSDLDGLNDQIVGTANGVDVLTIDGILDGDYDISILGPIDDGTPDVDVDVDVHVTATDGDGDLVGSVLNINVHFDLNQVLTPPVQEA